MFALSNDPSKLYSIKIRDCLPLETVASRGQKLMFPVHCVFLRAFENPCLC